MPTANIFVLVCKFKNPNADPSIQTLSSPNWEIFYDKEEVNPKLEYLFFVEKKNNIKRLFISRRKNTRPKFIFHLTLLTPKETIKIY